ncbi:MAG: hypothetical protein JWM63_1483 [Gammaproteobacteria bacterium]|jgi:predicted dithiol-disulfide oxidoreductase (DUF899 family)|nr:hypothetical protein [Gammaproteobacteria bacterium]
MNHRNTETPMNEQRIVSPQEWLTARQRLLAKEKELTHLREELARERRELPWEHVDKTYAFEGAAGKETLADLFDGRSQLIVYHFMFAPDWEAGCRGCSFWADGFNGIVDHVNQRDVSLVAVSQAPLQKLQEFARRLGWTFKWVSSAGSDFNYDYQVTFRPEALARGAVTYNYTTEAATGSDKPGVSVFLKRQDGSIVHTYSCYGRGLDTLNAAYQYIDLTPKGRDEAGLPHPMAWVKIRDLYGT